MALGGAIGRLARRVTERRSPGCRDDGRVVEGPRSAYELVTRRALDDLTRNFDRLETKVNGLIFGVILTFAMEVWKSFR